MTENALDARLESLETRLMHQEASLDELTKALVTHEKLVRKQIEIIKHLEAQLKDLSASNISSAEEPPPHY